MFRQFIFIAALIILTGQSTAFGQVSASWAKIPVLDSGRVMPLDSFARRIVTEICGEPNPVFVLDNSVLEELNQIMESLPKEDISADALAALDANPKEENRFLTQGIDVEQFENHSLLSERENTEVKDDKKTARYGIANRRQCEQIIRRIRALTPAEGQRYPADELLLSWISEPEVWEFIPIFPADDAEYREEVLKLPVRNDSKVRLKRVSPHQLKISLRFQQRLDDLWGKKQHIQQIGSLPNIYDQITEKVDAHRQIYETLTYHPLLNRPARMIDLLRQAVDDSYSRDSSYSAALKVWGELLSVGEVPDLQSVEAPAAPKLAIQPKLHPTTQRWHEIAERIRVLAGVFDKTADNEIPVTPNLAAVEKQFEQLLDLLAVNLDESEALIEKAYPGTKYRHKINIDGKFTQPAEAEKVLPLLFSADNVQANREALAKAVLGYYYSVKVLHNEIEAAYLALYDNGRSLRLVPVRSSLALNTVSAGKLDVHPWGNFQMLAYGGEDFIRRFFDPEFQLGTIAAPVKSADTIGGSSASEEKPLAPETKDDEAAASVIPELTDNPVLTLEQKLEQELFTESPHYNSLSLLRTANTPSIRGGIVGQIRSSFNSLAAGYLESSLRMDDFADALQITLRTAAGQVETLRSRFFTPDELEEDKTREVLAKIAYPAAGTTAAEYRYFRLSPFFWMGVFATLSVFLTAFSLLTGQIRYEWRIHSIDAAAAEKEGKEAKEAVLNRETDDTAAPPFSAEECLNWLAILMLFLAAGITFLGGAMRAWITGWAPVTNMYETIVLMAFCVMLLGLGFALSPYLAPVWRISWRFTAFPPLSKIFRLFTAKPKQPAETNGQQAMREAAEQFGVPLGTAAAGAEPSDPEALKKQRTLVWQSALSIPRIILMVAVFFLLIQLSYREYAHQHGIFAAAVEMFRMSDVIDWFVVVASIALLVWYIPRLILAGFAAVFVLFRPALAAQEEGIVSTANAESSKISQPEISNNRTEMGKVFQGEANVLQPGTDNSGQRFLNRVRNQILDRKLFVFVASVIALCAGSAAYFNTSQFSPDIRPLAAVLRSNFWLTVHVIAIIVSYAAGFAAWGISAAALGWIIFGRYQYFTAPNGHTQVLLPAVSEMFALIIHRLIQIALVMLILGTVLGARWADYSWGRFWSWDPKEVWALITILVYAVILHGRIAQWYGKVGIMLGALFASIAVIITWYGINFVFKGSMHSYGGGENTGATYFLWGFIIVNIFWGFLAMLRYSTEAFGREIAEE
ncbi:MAG: cytochrome c biogenesis protein CcsA [Planctomycetaceae bacterium]|nr:cytochrome c biogenesis protein CcsA [Planctomycetaceae bacterium]